MTCVAGSNALHVGTRDFHAQDTLRVRRTGRFDAPTDKAPKRPFLGLFDAGRTETRRSVLGPRKREKTATPTVGDKSSPDAPLRA